MVGLSLYIDTQWQVYEKELAKGTLEMTSQNAKVIKKYVHAFFDRHGSYDGSSSTH